MQMNSQWYCRECLQIFSKNRDLCPTSTCNALRPSSGWGKIFQQGEIFSSQYSIHQLLAVGGSGVTYLAQSVDDGMDLVGPLLAIKVIFTRRDNDTYLERLMIEAQVLQKLQHVNIIGYIHFDASDTENPYLITHYAEGGNLFEHLKDFGILTVQACAQIGLQLCNALQTTHEKGVIHRDLKPENILLRSRAAPEGPFELLVADFGIAKLFSPMEQELASTGGFVGTPQYAAPEQFMGQAATTASDIYSLSAVLLFCSTGQHMIHYATTLSGYNPDEIWELYSQRLPPTVILENSSSAEIALFQELLNESMRVDPRTRCNLIRYRELLEQIVALDSNYQPVNVVDVSPLEIKEEPMAFDLVQPELFEDETKPMARGMLEDDPTLAIEMFSSLEDTDSLEVTEVEERGSSPQESFKWLRLLIVISAILGGIAGWIGLLDHTLVLTGGETEATLQKDYTVMYYALDKFQDDIERQCNILPGATVIVTIKVEANGRITDLQFKSIPLHFPKQCVSDILKGRIIPNRAQAIPVWMPKQFTW